MNRNPSSFLIYFCGVDGSGKSTLSKMLRDELSIQGYDVSYFWWLNAEESLIRRTLKKIAGNKLPLLDPSKKDNEKNGNGWFEKVFVGLVLSDYYRQYLLAYCLPRTLHRKRIFIFDRYIYDVIVSLSESFSLYNCDGNSQLSWILNMFRAPDISLFIEVTPDISLQRKPMEILSIENANKNLERHQAIMDCVDKTTLIKIDNTNQINSAYYEIISSVKMVINEQRL